MWVRRKWRGPSPTATPCSVSAPGPLAINPSLFKGLSFDPLKDFAPIALVANVPIVLVVKSEREGRVGEGADCPPKSRSGKCELRLLRNGSTNHLAGTVRERWQAFSLCTCPIAEPPLP